MGRGYRRRAIAEGETVARLDDALFRQDRSSENEAAVGRVQARLTYLDAQLERLETLVVADTPRPATASTKLSQSATSPAASCVRSGLALPSPESAWSAPRSRRPSAGW